MERTIQLRKQVQNDLELVLSGTLYESEGDDHLSFRQYSGVARIIAQIYYDRSDFDIGYPVPIDPPELFKETQTGERWGAEIQFNKRLWDRHVLTLGGEFRDDFHQHRRCPD